MNDISIIIEDCSSSTDKLLVYNIFGERFCYYHSPVDAIKIDIISELESVQIDGDHEISISGYPILFARIIEDQIIFSETEFCMNNKNIIGSISRKNFTIALHEALEVVERIIRLQTLR